MCHDIPTARIGIQEPRASDDSHDTPNWQSRKPWVHSLSVKPSERNAKALDTRVFSIRNWSIRTGV